MVDGHPVDTFEARVTVTVPKGIFVTVTLPTKLAEPIEVGVTSTSIVAGFKGDIVRVGINDIWAMAGTAGPTTTLVRNKKDTSMDKARRISEPLSQY
jgi:hypothetical protein